MKITTKLTAVFLIAGLCTACSKQLPADTRDRLCLAGNWGLQLDTAGIGITPDLLAKSCTDSLLLPGTTDRGKREPTIRI
ncbi:MAG: hypothetical protein LUH63_07505 [Parabacteroides sp.]|nr:hypothetical protein [Parabacteroides sp.]